MNLKEMIVELIHTPEIEDYRGRLVSPEVKIKVGNLYLPVDEVFMNGYNDIVIKSNVEIEVEDV